MVNKLLSYLPTPLPVGMTAYNKWLASIRELAGPIANPDDMDFVVSSAIMHLGEARAYIPKAHFVKILRKAAANQLAGAKFQEIKFRQQEAVQKAQAEAAAKTVEATTSTVEASNAPDEPAKVQVS